MKINLILVELIALLIAVACRLSTDLDEVVQKALGVYRDPLKSPGLNRTIIVTASNRGYLNHLHNFKCFMDRLNMKFLVIALDTSTGAYLSQYKDMNHFYDKQHTNVVREDNHNFRSRQFNLLSKRKLEAVYKILKKGYDVIFIDTDVLSLKDPTELLLYNAVDYVFALNFMCPPTEESRSKWDFSNIEHEGNTGFYFARSTPKVLKLFDHYFQSEDDLSLDDQTLFWRAVRSFTRNSSNPRVVFLPVCRDQYRTITQANSEDVMYMCYPHTCSSGSGAIHRFYEYASELKQNNMKMHIVHANFLVGNHAKQKKLEERGLWLAQHDKDGYGGKCKDLDKSKFEGLL